MKSICNKIVIFAYFVIFCININAQPYTVNPTNFEFSMNIVGKVYVQAGIIDQQNSFLGAFINNECVGVASPIEDEGTFQLFYLTAYSNQISGEQIEFRFTDESETEFLISNTVEFVADKYFGSAEKPFLWMDVALYASTDFLSFSFEEQFSPAIINSASNTINIVVTQGTNLSSLIPSFETSPGSKVFIEGIEQVSEVNSANFADEVVYTVEGVDGSSSSWTVNVSLDNSDIETFEFNSPSVYPNPTVGVLNIYLDNSIYYKSNLRIVDILGKTVYSGNFGPTFGCSINVVDISSLKAGVYFVIIENEMDCFVRKVEKK